jgi:1-deoxy-D-xylulose-5-phosphate reductoisomerase
MAKPQRLCILGSTGTIGQNTLDVVRHQSHLFDVFALCAHSNVERMLQDCLEFEPTFAVMVDELAAKRLNDELTKLSSNTQVLSGISQMSQISCHENVDTVMAAIVGSAGLLPAIAAARSGKRILLANKETLVMAGDLFMQAVKQGNAELLPIDSEHNAIFQVMPAGMLSSFEDAGIKKIILTASGGPFRQLTYEQLEKVSVKQALAHPNWVMGPKITIDSATLMNKGLEVIEAHWLFNAQAEQIDVVVHPQSIIHSMVEYVDGSVLAQLGTPDMRTPIAYALAYPNRIQSGVKPLDFTQLSKLEFEQPDYQRFPCLSLAFEALKMGGNASAIVNAANEVAVSSFIQEKIGFNDIARLIESVLNRLPKLPISSLDHLLDIDTEARAVAHQWVEGKTC